MSAGTPNPRPHRLAAAMMVGIACFKHGFICKKAVQQPTPRSCSCLSSAVWAARSARMASMSCTRAVRSRGQCFCWAQQAASQVCGQMFRYTHRWPWAASRVWVAALEPTWMVLRLQATKQGPTLVLAWRMRVSSMARAALALRRSCRRQQAAASLRHTYTEVGPLATGLPSSNLHYTPLAPVVISCAGGGCPSPEVAELRSMQGLTPAEQGMLGNGMPATGDSAAESWVQHALSQASLPAPRCKQSIDTGTAHELRCKCLAAARGYSSLQPCLDGCLVETDKLVIAFPVHCPTTPRHEEVSRIWDSAHARGAARMRPALFVYVPCNKSAHGRRLERLLAGQDCRPC